MAHSFSLKKGESKSTIQFRATMDKIVVKDNVAYYPAFKYLDDLIVAAMLLISKIKIAFKISRVPSHLKGDPFCLITSKIVHNYASL
jgi:hypothetical protein